MKRIVFTLTVVILFGLTCVESEHPQKMRWHDEGCLSHKLGKRPRGGD